MSNRKLDYSIKDKYCKELDKIQEKLTQLEEKRIYEFTQVSSDGSLTTNVDQLKELLGDLLNKIQNGEKGTEETFADYFKY